MTSCAEAKFFLTKKQSDSPRLAHPFYIGTSAPHSWLRARFEEAVSAYKKAIHLSPDDITAHILLAITYAMMGQENEARSEGAEVLRIDPKFSVERFVKTFPPGARRDRTTPALLKAGLK